MDSDVIVNYGSHFLRGMSIAGPFMCIDFLAVGVFQAVGMGREALIFAILRKIVLEIPALWILNILFPLYGLAYAQSVAEFGLSIAAIVVMSRLFKRLSPPTAGMKSTNKTTAVTGRGLSCGLIYALFFFFGGLHAGLFEHVAGGGIGRRRRRPTSATGKDSQTFVQRAGQGEQVGRGDQDHQLARRGDIQAVHAVAEGLAGRSWRLCSRQRAGS